MGGHFLFLPFLMPKTKSCADFKTPFMNVTGLCLQLQYTQLYKNIRWEMEIYLRNEELEMNLIKFLKDSENISEDDAVWHTLLIRLPDRSDLQQLVVKIIRPIGAVDSGLAIDDVTVRPCSDFSKLL